MTEPKDQRHSVSGGNWLKRQDYRNIPQLRGQASRRERSREEALADWVGEENRPEVFAAFRPHEKEIGKVLDIWLSTMQPEEMDWLDRIKANWPALVGDVNARQCEPVSVDGKQLKVEVFSGTWMYIMKTQQLAIISKNIAEFTQQNVCSVVLAPSRNFKKK